ncbi:MAG TPA: hypothetical protein VFN23_00450 [Ktedonobacteraceae bacterium]|nr:hypothetical protein [Ktedonobacteraceae bacterium]
MQKKNKHKKPIQIPRYRGVILAALILLSCLVWNSLSFGRVIAASTTTKLIQTETAETPWGLALDTGNHIWIAEPGCDAAPVCASNFPGSIGEYDIRNASLIRNYSQPQGFAGPLFLAVDTSNHIWFTEPGNNALGELIPGPQPLWRQWKIPTTAAIPYQILVDHNGNLWFSEFGSGDIGFFNPHSQHFIENALPTANSHPYGLTLDRFGTIWIAENSAGKLASFIPNPTGKVRINERSIPTPSPHLLTSDSQGHIWYSAGFYGSIGRFTPATGQIIQYQVSRNACKTPPNCQGTHISGIAADKQGIIWFDDSLAQRLGNLNPTTGIVKNTNVADVIHPQPHPHDGLIIDAQGDLWCTEEFANRLIELPAPIPHKHKPPKKINQGKTFRFYSPGFK